MNNLKSKPTLLSSLLVFVLLSLLGVLFFTPQKANALSGSQFEAGRIIDDPIFYNSSSMTATQIQAFLDSKVPNCDTNGTKPYGGTTRAAYGTSRGYPPPYICLKNYTQNIPTITNGGSDLCKNSISGGTKSAAQIIKQVGYACGVSPKVLIVLLEKEQSLVTDDWPWSIQYRSATGYGCPDTAPCDSEYYGFFNQVYQAAKAFKRYEANPNSFNYKAGRNNYIYYHPSLGACGGSNVYIENQATANLYIYTPYQPNQAALNNLYGTGNSCSAYGNRNFWRLFNDWFGSTHGSLFRTVNNSTLYYTDGNRKYAVGSMKVVGEYGMNSSNIRYVSQGELDAIPNASSPHSSSLGTLVKSISDTDEDGSTVYLITNGTRFPIGSVGIMGQFGYQSSDISYLSIEAILRIPPSDKNLSRLIKIGSSGTVYYVDTVKKKIIFEGAKLAELNTGGNISKLGSYAGDKLPYGTPMVDGDYVVKKGASIRVYNSDEYFVVGSLGVADCWNLSNIKTFSINSYSRTKGSDQGSLKCVAQNLSGDTFIMNGSKRVKLPSGHGLDFSTPSDSLINSLPQKNISTVIRGPGSNLSTYENFKKRSIKNMRIFNELGYTSSDITTIPGGVAKSIPTGAQMLSVGSLFKEGSSSTIYVATSQSSSLTIPSAKVMKDYGYKSSKALTVNSQAIAKYTSSGTLQNLVKNGSNAYLVDMGKKYLIDSSIDTHLGINRATLPELDNALLSDAQNSNMTRFIKSAKSSTIYYLQNGQKRAIGSWGKLVSLGGEGKILKLSDAYVSSVPTGSNI